MRRLEELPASDLIHPRIPKAPKLPRLDRTSRQTVEEPKRDPAPAQRESGAPPTRRRMADTRDDAAVPGAKAKPKPGISHHPVSGPVLKVRTPLDDRKWASKAMGACAAIGLVGTVVIWLAR